MQRSLYTGVILTDGPLWAHQRRYMLRHVRDFLFGTRSATLENLMQQEIQDVVEILNGRKEDKVCVQQQPVFACDSLLIILVCSSQAISLLIVH